LVKLTLCTLNKIYIQVIQLLEIEGAPEVADSGGPPANGRWAGGASPPLHFAIAFGNEQNTE